MSFTNIVGHEEVIQLLKGQLTQGRVPHTTLFVGSRGIGKRTLGMEFTKALHCERPALGGPCDVCDPCRQIPYNSFPDVLVVAPESQTAQIGIDQVRDLTRWMNLTPLKGCLKVGLVDEADSLTEQAAHAFLRLLEEPPERSFLILLSTAVNRLPSTFVSRCHVIRCWPQGIPHVARFLREKEKLDPVVSHLLATLSGGRLGLALQLHRQKRLLTKNTVLDELLAAHRRGDLEVSLGKSSRGQIEEALEWLAAWWRDLLVLTLKGDPAWVIHQDRLKDLRLEAGRPVASLDGLLERIERTYRVEEAIQKNASPRIALSTLLSR